MARVSQVFPVFFPFDLFQQLGMALAVDAATGEGQRLETFFGDGFLAILAEAVAAFLKPLERRIELKSRLIPNLKDGKLLMAAAVLSREVLCIGDRFFAQSGLVGAMLSQERVDLLLHFLAACQQELSQSFGSFVRFSLVHRRPFFQSILTSVLSLLEGEEAGWVIIESVLPPPSPA
jgi:hypothetical protein